MDADKPAVPEATPPAPEADGIPLVVLQGAGVVIKTRLVVPSSLGLRHQIVSMVAKNEHGSAAAALGICSSTLQRAAHYDHDPLPFGSRVIDYLLAQGVLYNDIVAAGRKAWLMLNAGLIHAKEVQAAEDFSEPTTAGSTG